jgi:hypothetical protein
MSLDHNDQPIQTLALNTLLGDEKFTLEISGEGKNKGHSATIKHALDIPPSSNKDNGLSSISSRGMQYSIYVLPSIRCACGLVLVALPCDLETRSFEEFRKFIIYTVNSVSAFHPLS